MEAKTDSRGDSGEILRQPALPPIPEGMSKSQWKKICKKQRFLDNKEKYAQIRKEKKQRAKENRKARLSHHLKNGEDVPEELKSPPRVNTNQVYSGVQIIIDCSFDDLMNDKEIISMSTQITRAYSSNRRQNHFAKIKVTSFNKRLKERFDVGLKDCNYQSWKNFEFVAEEELPNENVVYLTADTDEKLETLEPGTVYIIGGIVDKNRYKGLCYNKAEKLGIPTKRLPIDEYIKLSGRKVLTTTHVIQLMLKYFDNHNWKEAFESVLPQRKLNGIESAKPSKSSVQGVCTDKDNEKQENSSAQLDTDDELSEKLL
ncbi:tRNA (guanine(9)-N(1))-methyltransferase Ecym_2793 [Eremothecium cymbalariae DBVPG|uniref:tRNA (guanine(9)-N1)-methyltransferase n=1 Tax=Eremothecium cymbalariae (strain CBS 270.75 / DBVPG 7215 / KCTC 17166 / NRRL Y-17582) TaxID=931890 RepID=G8JQ28_ERECY|nr:Hypothetical protein Ecym_2793 [Eremothecium cymbalariae DBVPG\